MFHLGNDGIIHFTETHKNKRYDNFCIDMRADDLEEDADYGNTKVLNGPNPESDGNDVFVMDADNSYRDYQTDYGQDYNDTYEDEYYHDYSGESNTSTCNFAPDNRLHTMVAKFCDYSFVSLPKCCDKHPNAEYLNLRYIFTDDE